MGYAERHDVDLTTDSSGDVTGYTPIVSGRVVTLVYSKTDFDNGVDFTITADSSGETIWTESNVNASKTVRPRVATHDTAGVASLYAAAGEPVETPVVVANERIKVVIAQGGNVKTGKITVYVV
jgi:hypothetical protein